MSTKKRGKATRSYPGSENHSYDVREIAKQVDACRIQTKPRIIDRALNFALNIERATQENNLANGRRCKILDIKQVR